MKRYIYRKTYLKKTYRVNAYITIEASYVIAILLFCVATLIVRAYKESARIKAGYVTHTAALEASRIEEIYKKDNFDIEAVKNYACSRVGSIGGLDTGSFDIHNGKNNADAVFKAGAIEYYIEDSINDPERFMRKITVLEGVYEKYKDTVQERTEE
ncbi:hypothetical protein HMPREF9333_01634 [Johnsonella ignava ATCC 51276]|uniref:Uncharacterized protein n=1 Tax=Johnsonella ignava ATCC 51276 TaxID=679200 RepID=G5GJ94_9FIRM|nr:hypothetical protein [Johnsonella ignava]EHI55219.1 hypothetical protein HMPREF9333_01634 [Johnsonella ignava ATCC 51276]